MAPFAGAAVAALAVLALPAVAAIQCAHAATPSCALRLWRRAPCAGARSAPARALGGPPDARFLGWSLPARRLRPALTPRLADSYNGGGQDWNNTVAWAKCGSGQNQSPINIADTTTVYNVRVRQPFPREHAPPLTPRPLRTQPALSPLQVSYGKSQAWSLEVTVNYLEVANIDTVTTGGNLVTANAFTDGITLDGTFSAWRGGRAILGGN